MYAMYKVLFIILFFSISARCEEEEYPVGIVKPILECIVPKDPGFDAYFGYEMNVMETINISIGDLNKFIPNPIDRSQTEVFSAIRSRNYPLSAFYVPVLNGEVKWKVNGYEVSASLDDNVCKTDWIAFMILLQQPTPPSNTLLSIIKNITLDTTGAVDEQVDVYSQTISATNYKVIVNITQIESSVSPVAAILSLFGDSVAFTKYTDTLNDLDLLFEIKTMNTGLEKSATLSSEQTPELDELPQEPPQESPKEVPISEQVVPSSGTHISSYVQQMVYIIAFIGFIV